MTITVKITKNYGQEAIYPVDDNARTFAAMVGTKTLTRDTIRHIKQLGYSVLIEQEVSEL